MSFFSQFFRFAVVGGLNTVIDLVVLNILMILTGITAGLLFPFIAALSSLAAMVNSFALNKLWTFNDVKRANVMQVGQFIAVTLLGMLIKVGIATLIVTFIPPFEPLMIPVMNMLSSFTYNN